MNQTNNTQTTKVAVVGISAKDLSKLLEGNAEDFAQFLDNVFGDKSAEKSEPVDNPGKDTQALKDKLVEKQQAAKKPVEPVFTEEDRQRAFEILNMSPLAYSKLLKENREAAQKVVQQPVEEPAKEWTLEEILAVPAHERGKVVPRTRRVRHDMKGSWVMRYPDSCSILPYEREYDRAGQNHLDQTCAWQGYIGEKPAPKTKKVVEYRNVFKDLDGNLVVGRIFNSEKEARNVADNRKDWVALKRVEFEVTEGEFDS